MDVLNFILALVALVIAILAYHKTGGLADVRKRIDQIASSEDLRKSLAAEERILKHWKDNKDSLIGKQLEELIGKEEEETPF